MSLYPNPQIDALKQRVLALENAGPGTGDFSQLIEIDLLASNFTVERKIENGEPTYFYSYHQLATPAPGVKRLTVLVSYSGNPGGSDLPPHPPHIVLPPDFSGVVTVANLAPISVYTVAAGFVEADPYTFSTVLTSTGSTVDIGYIAGVMLSAGGLTTVLQRLDALESAVLNQPPDFSVLVEVERDAANFVQVEGGDWRYFPVPIPPPGVRHITILITSGPWGDLEANATVMVPWEFDGAVTVVNASMGTAFVTNTAAQWSPSLDAVDKQTVFPGITADYYSMPYDPSLRPGRTSFQMVESSQSFPLYQGGEVSDGELVLPLGSVEGAYFFYLLGAYLDEPSDAALKVTAKVQRRNGSLWEDAWVAETAIAAGALDGNGWTTLSGARPGEDNGTDGAWYPLPALRVRYTVAYQGAPSVKAKGLEVTASTSGRTREVLSA